MTAEVIPFRSVTPQASGGRTLYCETRSQHRREAMDNFYTSLRHAHVDAFTAYDRTMAFGDDYDRLTACVAAAMSKKACR
jgi:hypothetical protein